ncbi:TPA: hypothetical protein RMI67_006065, partial [Bacillus cereus]|nr:hypothetical protein [Bacillus cereus]
IIECDEIFILDKGEIIEQGDFNTLMRKDGKFKKLYDSQNEKIKINV